jgi:diacylglycerol O-acyltransferase / wax synthase
MADLSALSDVEFDPRMSDSDALMWNIEKDPLLRSTITMVMVLDRSPDRDRFTRRMERASRLVPRLRQRVLHHPLSIAPPRWEVDPNFDLHYHLRWMRAAGDGTLREVFDIAEPIAMQGFDRARPLWEFTVVEGLTDGGAALIVKVHHSVTDGVGGMKLQMEMLDIEREPSPRPEDLELPEAPRPLTPSERQRWIDATTYEATRQFANARQTAGSAFAGIRRLASDPVGVGTDALRTAGSIGTMLKPATEPLSPLMTGRSLSVRFDTIRIPLGGLKQASKVVSGRLNDGFVAGVTGGFRRYHQHHGFDHVTDLRMAMPVNVRTESTASSVGNHFVPARFLVPIGLDDPIARMTAIRELVAKQRAEPALAMTEPLAGILNRLPTSAVTGIFGSMLKGVDFITSNVPGVPVPVYLAGARMEAQIALGPMSGSAANAVLVSYLDDLNIGVNTDPVAIADPEVLLDCLRDSFDEILKLA